MIATRPCDPTKSMLPRKLNVNEPHQQKPIKNSFCASLRRDAHWKCLILTLLICGCLGAIAWCRAAIITTVVVSYYGSKMSDTTITQSSPCEDGYIYIPVAFVIMLYLVYLVECWHSHTRIELHHKVDVQTVYEKIAHMKDAIPILWWKALCYHYVRKTRHVTRYRNGDSFTTTQVYYERINSHTAGSAFNFSQCGVKDVSTCLSGLENYPATKIKFSKGFSFASIESECEFDEQRNRFFRENERRDDYMETREGLDLLNVNFKEYMIAFADPDNLPWYVSHVIFWVASCLLLSWPLRVIIEYKTAYVHYHVHKLFGTNYVELDENPSQMTRVNTLASADLEYTIQNNYALVPSYSEALLMASETIYHEIPDANGNLTSPIYGAKRSVTYGSLSSATKQPDALQSFPSGSIPSMRRCHSYTIVNGGLVIQNDMQCESYANRPRRKSRRLLGPWRREDSASSNHPVSSPSSPQECVIAINPYTSTVRVHGLNRPLNRGHKENGESNNTGTVLPLNLENRPRPIPLRSASAYSIGHLPAVASRPTRLDQSGDSPPCYDDALSMDRPLFEADPISSSRLNRTSSSRNSNTSQRQSVQTIMETSL